MQVEGKVVTTTLRVTPLLFLTYFLSVVGIHKEGHVTYICMESGRTIQQGKEFKDPFHVGHAHAQATKINWEVSKIL